LVETHVVAKFY